MSKRWFYVLLLPLVTLLLSGCIRDSLPDCPPMCVQVVVKDKNYFNITDAVKLGYAERKAEDLPFRDYVSSLYYVVYDAEGKVVAEQINAPVENDEQTQVIQLPSSLPYGKYKVEVWGNMKTDRPIAGNISEEELENVGVVKSDLYLASGEFDYHYGAENFMLEMERAKGDLMIRAEGLPDNIDFSAKSVDNIYGLVRSGMVYQNLVTLTTKTAWEQPNEILTQTLLCPSVGIEASTLHVAFAEGEISGLAAGRATQILVPEDVHITMGRNQLTILKYVYKADSGTFEIYLRVNDNWEKLHGMEID